VILDQTVTYDSGMHLCIIWQFTSATSSGMFRCSLLCINYHLYFWMVQKYFL